MFATLSRSWQFACQSCRILWSHKRLLVFPAISTVAAVLVVSLASSAANAIFKGCLYVYATGQAVPAEVDTSGFDAAFRPGG